MGNLENLLALVLIAVIVVGLVHWKVGARWAAVAALTSAVGLFVLVIFSGSSKPSDEYRRQVLANESGQTDQLVEKPPTRTSPDDPKPKPRKPETRRDSDDSQQSVSTTTAQPEAAELSPQTESSDPAPRRRSTTSEPAATTTEDRASTGGTPAAGTDNLGSGGYPSDIQGAPAGNRP